jgi:creatinine amidohydrolase
MKKMVFIVIIAAVLLLSGFIFSQYLAKGGAGAIQPDKSIFKDTMVEMSWQEVQKAAKNGAVVIFPIAVVEEHGPHMDLSPDIYLTSLGCRFLKQDLAKKGIEAIIAPPYYWGINQATGDFPGSFTQTGNI